MWFSQMKKPVEMASPWFYPHLFEALQKLAPAFSELGQSDEPAERYLVKLLARIQRVKDRVCPPWTGEKENVAAETVALVDDDVSLLETPKKPQFQGRNCGGKRLFPIFETVSTKMARAKRDDSELEFSWGDENVSNQCLAQDMQWTDADFYC